MKISKFHVLYLLAFLPLVVDFSGVSPWGLVWWVGLIGTAVKPNITVLRVQVFGGLTIALLVLAALPNRFADAENQAMNIVAAIWALGLAVATGLFANNVFQKRK